MNIDVLPFLSENLCVIEFCVRLITGFIVNLFIYSEANETWLEYNAYIAYSAST